MRAGFEIGVASTKAFTAQLTCILLLVLFLAKRRGLTLSQYDHLLKELQTIPQKITDIINQTDTIRNIARQISQYKNMFFLGRAWQYPIACE
jgi:glucosamine--fructose-6-phosphate aminotransferase (isomerizing)